MEASLEECWFSWSSGKPCRSQLSSRNVPSAKVRNAGDAQDVMDGSSELVDARELTIIGQGTKMCGGQLVDSHPFARVDERLIAQREPESFLLISLVCASVRPMLAQTLSSARSR